MAVNTSFDIAVLPGDGIGREIMAPCVELLERLARRIGGVSLRFETLDAGAAHYLRSGEALPEETLARARAADAILLGAMGLPDIRYPDGREIAPQLDLRERFELFAGIRPVRTFPGLPVPLADPRGQALDFVLIRESTEGLFSARGKTRFEASPSSWRAGARPGAREAGSLASTRPTCSAASCSSARSSRSAPPATRISRRNSATSTRPRST
jgi:3-isopropylmalate dehydrogenase